MKNNLVWAALSILGLAACAPMPAGQDPLSVNRTLTAANTHTVAVTVTNNRVSVGEEPVYIFEKFARVVIVWRLDSGPRYKFDPANGIVVKADGTGPAPTGLICGLVLSIETLFGCAYDLPPSGTSYKYSVQVLDKSTNPPTSLRPLDPRIINDY